MTIDLKSLTTETRNSKTMNLDQMSTRQFLEVMNEEDQGVAIAVREQLGEIEKAVQATIASFNAGGRIIYLGAGTSGRLGVLDAVECPPTYGTAPEEVVGLIAGGEAAFVKAVEGAEDSEELAVADLKSIHLTANDTVVGIAASGRTPYVIGGLVYANELGAKTVAVSCNKNAKISQYAMDAKIEVEVGPEVVTGSTRLKAGTAQKLVLNMISTATMVGIGKVFNNLMVDVQLTNLKLVERAKKIVMDATDCDYATAEATLAQAENKPKVAIVMILAAVNAEQAHALLAQTNGFVAKAIQA